MQVKIAVILIRALLVGISPEFLQLKSTSVWRHHRQHASSFHTLIKPKLFIAICKSSMQ
jgi:hypothetical protein